MIAYDLSEGRWHAIQTFCECWSCDHCGHMKAWELAERCSRANANRFITLTCLYRPDETPRQVFDATRRQIAELGKVIRKTYGEYEYCRVLETTKTGYPHYHLIVRSNWIDQKGLSDKWCKLTGSMIVDIRKIWNAQQTIKYVLKYVSKQDSVPFTKRRISYSRGFAKARKREGPARYHFIETVNVKADIETATRWETPNLKWNEETERHWIA